MKIDILTLFPEMFKGPFEAENLKLGRPFGPAIFKF